MMDENCNTNGLIRKRVLGCSSSSRQQSLAQQQRSALVALACPDLPPSALSGRGLHLQVQQRARCALGRHERACASGYRPHLRAAATARAVMEQVAYPPPSAAPSAQEEEFDLAGLFADVPRPGKEDSLFPLPSFPALVAEEAAWGRLARAMLQPAAAADVLTAIAEGGSAPKLWCSPEELEPAAEALDIRAVAARVAAARPASAAEAEERQRTSVFGRVVPGPEELAAAAAGSGATHSSATAVATDAEAEAAAAAARAEAAARERLLQRWCAEALPSRAALLAAATSHMVLAQLRQGARESHIGFMWNGRTAALIDALLTHWALPPLGLHELTALGALLQALAGCFVADRDLLQSGLAVPPFKPQEAVRRLQPLAFFATPDGLCRAARVIAGPLLSLGKVFGAGIMYAKVVQLAQIHVAALQHVLPSSAEAAAAEGAAATPEAAATRRRELVSRCRSKYTSRVERALVTIVNEFVRVRGPGGSGLPSVKLPAAAELAVQLAAAAFPPAAEAAAASAWGSTAVRPNSGNSSGNSSSNKKNNSVSSASPIGGSFGGDDGECDAEDGQPSKPLPAAAAVVRMSLGRRSSKPAPPRDGMSGMMQEGMRIESQCEAERLTVAAALAAALAQPDVRGEAAERAARRRATLVTVGAAATHHALLQAALVAPIHTAPTDVNHQSHPVANRAMTVLAGAIGDKLLPVAMVAACRGEARRLLGGCGIMVMLARNPELADAHESQLPSGTEQAKQKEKPPKAQGVAGGAGGSGSGSSGQGTGEGGDPVTPLEVDSCAVQMRFVALPPEAQERLSARRKSARRELMNGWSPGQRLLQRKRIESHLRSGGRSLLLTCPSTSELMSAVAICAELSSEWLHNDGRALALVPLWDQTPPSMLGGASAAAEDVWFLSALRERLLLELFEGHRPQSAPLSDWSRRLLRPDWQARQRLALQRLLGSLSGVPTSAFIGWRAGDTDNVHAATGWPGMMDGTRQVYNAETEEARALRGHPFFGGYGAAGEGGLGRAGAGSGAGVGLQLLLLECEPGRPTEWL